MKVVLASPKFPQPRGNTVTVRRIASNLEKLGVSAEIISTTEEQHLHPLPPGDLVHGFHAYQFHQFMQKMEQPPGMYVVTMTGTDLNVDLFDPLRRADVLACLRGAAAIHVFDEKAKSTVLREAPDLAGKVFAIAQGNSDFPSASASLKKERDSFVFLLPAGIRKVKNVPAAISMLSKLQMAYPQLRLWIVGPVLEEVEWQIVKGLVEEHAEWIRYLGQMPHAEMGALYPQADAVLNSSHSEGQPAAILEAMGFGLPVLVSDIPGNSGIVTHQETGFLYGSEREFLAHAEKLMLDRALNERIGKQAAHYIEEHHSGAGEAHALLEMYNAVMK